MLKLNPFTDSILNNPLYQLEARYLKRGATPESLKVWSRTVILRVFLIFSLLIVIFGLLLWYSMQRGYFYSRQNPTTLYYTLSLDTHVYHTLVVSMALLFILSIIFNITLDFATIKASLEVINQSAVKAHWDLVHLTTLKEQQIVYTQHTLARLRSWNRMIAIFGMRIMVLVLLVLSGLASLSEHPRGFWAGLGDVISRFFSQPLETTLLLVLLGVWVFAYLGEMIWRHHTLTAITLGLSTGRNTTNALLTGVGSVFAFWISQGFLVFSMLWVITSIHNQIFPMLSQTGGNTLLPIILSLFASVVVIAVFYRYYRTLYEWGLRTIERRTLAE